MNLAAHPRALVVNFNSPELNTLALALARSQRLLRYVRPYINKGRLWERTLAGLPLAGSLYNGSFGRRQLNDRELGRLTHEAGVMADLCAAGVGRLSAIPSHHRQRWTNELYKSVRESVATAAGRLAHEAECVVAYEGFALPSFESMRSAGSGRSVLNYPVAHHRYRRRMRAEENERRPLFASTWPDFDDWPAGHEERLDDEIRLADGVLVGSTFARDTFVAEGIDGAKVHVVPYGVDLDTFRPAADAAPSGGFEVIFAGQLTQRKGLSYLLGGYARFARPDSRLTLVGSLVGDGRALQPWREQFQHVPHRTRPALAAMYRESHVFVLPTLVEGMPLVVLEAMACGLPVIVTSHGPGDIVRDGVDGFVVPARDEDAICDRLERLYNDPEARRQMGRNACARARAFSWDAYASNVQDYLAGLCAPTSVGRGTRPMHETPTDPM